VVDVPTASKAQIGIIDAAGRVLIKKNIAGNAVQTIIDIKGFTAGSYQLLWMKGANTQTRSVIIQ